MIGALHGPWFLCAALLLLGIATRMRARKGFVTADLVVVAVLAVLGAVARLALGPWGPLHVNGQGPLWIRGALDPAPLAGYGPGYFELFSWAARFGTAADRAIFTANALLSALAPALLYVTARLVGVAFGGALVVSIVLAADPVTVWTAASESYFSALITLVLGVQAALALGVRAHVGDDRLARNLAFLSAGLLAATVARIHPMAYLPLALCPLVVIGAARPERLRSRLALAVLAAVVIGVTVAATSIVTIVSALRASHMTEQAITGIAARDYPLPLGLLLIALLLHRWLPPAWLPLMAVCSLVLLLATHNAFQQSPLWKLCYQRNFLPGILLGVAPFFPPRLRHRAWPVLGGAVALIALTNTTGPHFPERTTEQHEHRWLQQTLPGMAPHCTLAAVSHAGIRVWEIPSYLLPAGDGQRTVARPADLSSAPGDCLLYVRSSLCSSVEARPLCEEVERDARLERVASQTFPAVPSYTGLPYDRSPVEVVVFRVTGLKRGVADGIAITPGFAQRLYERLTPLRESDGCRVVRLDTSRFRMTIGLQTPAGAELTVEVATAPGGEASAETGGWTLVVSDEARRDCGATVATLEGVLRDLGSESR